MYTDQRGTPSHAAMKYPAAWALVAGVLLGVQVGYAPSAGAAQPAASTTKTKIEVPEAMRKEHEALHSELERLTESGGRSGEAAKAVAKVLEPHFQAENEYALPPLSLLIPLSQGKFQSGMTDVLKLTDKLESAMPSMLAEHKEIESALKKLHDAAAAENKRAGVEFAEHLTAHAKEEEEITYPTALLIGRYVKLRSGRTAR